MRLPIIVNPASGGGRGRHLARRLADALERRGHDVTVFETRGPGDAERRADDLGTGADRLVVVGGDGTLNEVINGLDDPSRVPVAQLATGTANILAHELGLPRDAEGAARLVETGLVLRIDLGLALGRRFLTVASCGFDAMVTREVAQGRNGALGYAGYVRPILRALRGYRPPSLRVTVDDAKPLEGELVIVSNTRNYGGIFRVAAGARCDSGHLDAVVIPDASIAGLVRAAAAALTGGASLLPGAHSRAGCRIRVESAAAVPVEMDGDFAGTTPLDVEVRARVVPIVVPRRPRQLGPEPRR